MRKLTLSVDPEVISLAKRLAVQRGTSVSDLFSQFVRSLAGPQAPAPTAPRTKKATGQVKWPRGKPQRRLVEEAMVQRHLPGPQS